MDGGMDGGIGGRMGKWIDNLIDVLRRFQQHERISIIFMYFRGFIRTKLMLFSVLPNDTSVHPLRLAPGPPDHDSYTLQLSNSGPAILRKKGTKSTIVLSLSSFTFGQITDTF